MELRKRINEIKEQKGICHYAKDGVEIYIINCYELLDKETMRKGVKVEVLAECNFFDIRVGNERTCHERMSDPEDAIAEMKAYMDYFEKENYNPERIDQNGISGFCVIL